MAFEKIKGYLSSPPVLKAPKAGKPFRLYIDAQEHVIGRQQGVCGSLHQQKVGGCRNKE
jgi:hypothetical protein